MSARAPVMVEEQAPVLLAMAQLVNEWAADFALMALYREGLASAEEVRRRLEIPLLSDP